MTEYDSADIVASVRRLIRPIHILVILACLSTASTWILLNRLYAHGEIEGPEIFVNGILLTAFLFAFPVSWYGLERLRSRFALIKSRRIAAATTWAASYLLSFVAVAACLFFTTDPLISFFNKYFH